MSLPLNNNLRLLRKQKNLTQQAVSDQLHFSGHPIDMKRYAKYEEGKSEPDLYTCRVLANYYGVSVEDLCFTDLTKK